MLRVLAVQRDGLVEAGHHRDVAQQVLDERAVFFGEAQLVREAPDHAAALCHTRAVAAAAGGARHQRGAALAGITQEANGREPGVHALHHDVLELVAQRELLGGFHAVGYQAQHASRGALFVVLGEARHQRAHAGAHTLEALLQLLERAQP